jgi:hypothetical protein
MKAIQFLGMTAFMAAMLTGCSNDSELAHSNFPDDNIIRVTAGVNGAVTRAEETMGTELNSNFSLTVINKDPLKENERDNIYSYGNKFFQKQGSEWICNDILLWQDAETKVDVAALAPAINEMTFNGIYHYKKKIQILEYSITANQETPKPENDLLYYYKSDLVPKNELKDGKLNIQFNHAFSMIDINVTLGTEYSKKDNPINEVIVGGSKLKATVDVTNRNGYGVAYASTTGENPETDIITTPGTFTKATTDEEKSKAAYSCILIPQKIEANKFKVTLKTSSKTYVWTSPDAITLETGHRYTLDLTMGKDVVTAQKGNISAGSWTEGTDSGSTLGTK